MDAKLTTDELPVVAQGVQVHHHQHRRRGPRAGRFLGIVTLAVLGYYSLGLSAQQHQRESVQVPLHAQEYVDKCKNLHTLPAPPPDFNFRTESDRYVEGTTPVLIKNATIWTGRVNGLEVVKGDVLLDKGLVKAVGHIPADVLSSYGGKLDFYDAHGAWVTPGVVDMHSHLGVYSAPSLGGASDGNSLHGPILPWLRALDGLNTHDDAYRLTLSGGVTTALVLPGSANSIGGQAFTIKLRPTAERSPTSMLLEAPYSINGTQPTDPSHPPRWRQMKHACGENPSRVYGNTRMDSIWALRSAYEKARQIKEKQDAFCEAALQGRWDATDGGFPEDLQWEALVDVLRGKVKVHNHCYETVDLNSMILMTQEFGFSIAAFHHAHETYLITDQLKTTHGQTPAAAIFATNARYKRESYRGTEFAPKILSEAGIRVVMKSDHPVLNSRHLVFEAQQAHHYGLPENLALASVISTPAEVMGLDHRIGYLKKGYDADLVVWDSHPLTLGATPKQVWSDGIAQLTAPYTVSKPASFQKAPKTPSWDKEAKEALEYEGLPPLVPKASSKDTVVFMNVKEVLVAGEDYKVKQTFVAQSATGGVVVAKEGEMICAGDGSACANLIDEHADIVDLEGGSLSPGLISFGSALGLQEIAGEASTQNGAPLDPLLQAVPSIAGGASALDRAVDGLQFGTRDALIAYIRGGVTLGISAPAARYGGFLGGISAAFHTAAGHKLEKGAVVQEDVALHITITPGLPVSVSTQIATLRHLLTNHGKGNLETAFQQVTKGEKVLLISVNSADVMASLVRLKQEIEEDSGKKIRFTFVGAQEAHLIASNLSENNIGVILIPARPYPGAWESRRILPGPPLTAQSSVAALLSHNVTVGLGVPEQWAARNTRLEVGWAAIEAGESFSKADALALATTNLEKLLGLIPSTKGDMVATRGGGLLDIESQVAGVISARRGVVDII